MKKHLKLSWVAAVFVLMTALLVLKPTSNQLVASNKPPLQLCSKYLDNGQTVQVSYHEYHPLPEYSGKVFLHYKNGETKVIPVKPKNVSIERIILSDRVLIRAKSLNPTN